MSLAYDDDVTPRERDLNEILEPFSLAPPALLGVRKLLRRTDTKFAFPIDQLADLLVQLRPDYALVPAGARRLASYRTLYFDTPDLECFHAHRRGCRPRHKVRLRHYPDRRVSFFEIKTKRSEVVTQKMRTDVPYGSDQLPDRAHDLVRAHGMTFRGPLEQQLWTNFHRLTLVGLRTKERVTIDLDLRLGQSGALIDLDGIVIAEVKQDSFCIRTPVMEVVRAAGLRPMSASKYCTAVALTREGLRFNRLLPALRMIDRMRT
jgi:hypothetical protein